MARKPKLDAEELSRVLSQAAVGKLRHWPWGSREDGQFAGCGCVAGAVYAYGSPGLDTTEPEAVRAIAISMEVAPSRETLSRDGDDYPNNVGRDPDAMLRYLERRGVA